MNEQQAHQLGLWLCGQTNVDAILAAVAKLPDDTARAASPGLPAVWAADQVHALTHAVERLAHELLGWPHTQGDAPACGCGLNERRQRLLRILAAPYAGRPGYRQEWR